MINGTTPNHYCAFASCDPIYLRDHAAALTASCAVNDQPLHLHVVNPFKKDLALLESLRLASLKIAGKGAPLTYTWEEVDLSKLNKEQKRVYYSLNRFLAWNKIMDMEPTERLGESKVRAALIIDIDCLVMQKLPGFSEDIGLFIREPFNNGNPWETLGSNVAAGVVYINTSERSKNYIREVAEDLETRDLRWFTDQVVLWERYNRSMHNTSCRIFGPEFMDWEFIENTTIWTGKGPRKYDNPVYVGKKEEFAELLEM